MAAPRPSVGVSIILLGILLGLFSRGYAPSFAFDQGSSQTFDPIDLLDSLEKEFPFCHAEAHNLDRTIFKTNKDLGRALSLCDHRCTNGCMHGMLSEAMSHTEPASIDALMTLCQGEGSGPRHKVGNCAHAFGHGLLIRAVRDLDRALDLCARLFDERLEYYCVTGVFMEYAEGAEDGHPGHAVGMGAEKRHLPCHTTAFPAACYRYLLEQMATVLPPAQLLGECLRLTDRVRLGCFHGFGAMYYQAVGEDPSVLPRVCGSGTLEDRTVCIEGAIERLADHDEQRARIACRHLQTETAEICWAAAREKMYRLEKATMKLYLP